MQRRSCTSLRRVGSRRFWISRCPALWLRPKSPMAQRRSVHLLRHRTVRRKARSSCGSRRASWMSLSSRGTRILRLQRCRHRTEYAWRGADLRVRFGDEARPLRSARANRSARSILSALTRPRRRGRHRPIRQRSGSEGLRCCTGVSVQRRAHVLDRLLEGMVRRHRRRSRNTRTRPECRNGMVSGRRS